ncbi:hypothetical protein [Methylobacterium crusticola]|nr:hypothetical protein [Methylobacterium crusticola]
MQTFDRTGISRLERGPDGARLSRTEDIRIIVTPMAEQRPARVSFLPWGLRLFLKLGFAGFTLLSIFVLPNYLDCRSQRDTGAFYYGMTVSACTRQNVWNQIGNTQRQFETVARAVGAR